MSYRRPRFIDLERGNRPRQQYEYKNAYGRTTKIEEPNVEIYLSGTRYEPRKLIVQASSHGNLQPASNWNRRKVSGSVPTALMMSEWAMSPAFDSSPNRRQRFRWAGIPMVLIRTLIVCLPLGIYMAFPLAKVPWDEEDTEDVYANWPGRLWSWPKFAVNPLDMKPDSPEVASQLLSSKPRLLRPRLLVVETEDGEWRLTDVATDENAQQPYVMVSYTNRHFHTSVPASGPDTSGEGRDTLRRIAVMQAKDAGVRAYWLDFECRAPDSEPELLTSDVNRFCDVVRGASRVAIALPDAKKSTARVWGSRMWTLPEGLLAPGDKIYVHYVDTDRSMPMTKVEMAALMWDDPDKPSSGDEIQGTRLLAEHYSGLLSLSRLQLLSTVLFELWVRKAPVRYDDTRAYTRTELAHALMGLLHTRIDPVEGNTLFQDIAKLSLLNDSDQLVEKMICLLPTSDKAEDADDDLHVDDSNDPFKTLVRPDQFNTHLWDIHPTCQVVGVDQDDLTIVVNDCRAVPIRWKTFPRMIYRRQPSFKKLVAELFLRSGAWWLLTAAAMSFDYASFWISSSHSLDTTHGTSDGISTADWLLISVCCFLGVGVILSLAGPLSIRTLYGGTVVRPSRHLVGFEGTMPIGKLEKIVFGNDAGRLAYQPSSTPLGLDHRDPEERVGREPQWITEPHVYPAPALRKGYRLFTLVDTGNMSISIFEAKRPPTVALICGREGGMLRTVLCSWDFVKNTLKRETVVRMPTDIYDMSITKGWLRLCLKL